MSDEKRYSVMQSTPVTVRCLLETDDLEEAKAKANEAAGLPDAATHRHDSWVRDRNCGKYGATVHTAQIGLDGELITSTS